MAGEWSLVLGDVTLDKTSAAGRELSFLPSVSRAVNEKGRTEGTHYRFECEANVIADSAADVADAFLQLIAQATDVDAIAFDAKLDGASVGFEIDPSECFWGPFVMSVEAVEDEGNGNGHWRARFVVEARKRVAPQYELDTRIKIRKNVHKQVVLKIWTATAKAATAEEAWTALQKFKPAGVGITVEYDRAFDKTEATAVWTWSALRKPEIRSYRCEVRRIPPEGWVVAKRVGVKVPPVLHEARLEPTIVEVVGEIVSINPVINLPGPHFTAGPSARRDPHRETGTMHEAAIQSEEEGTYYRRFHEVWIFDGQVPPAKHSDGHNLISLLAPPADGAMAS